MLRVLFFSLLFCASPAFAESFATVQAYLAFLTKGQAITSSSIASFPDGGVVGAVQWSAPPGSISQTESPYLASIFILEKLPNNQYIEIVHSIPSDGFSGSATQTIAGVEVQSNSRFLVRLASFKPLGGVLYRFAQRGKFWYLSGRDEQFLYFDPAGGDESVGETREERSTNFLTGQVIEKKYRKNRLVSQANRNTTFPQFPFHEFRFFDDSHGSL